MFWKWFQKRFNASEKFGDPWLRLVLIIKWDLKAEVPEIAPFHFILIYFMKWNEKQPTSNQ